ncbi:thiol oxidoreductase [Rhodospirillaceae bacterium KN72]|uniref:Thiol oxidoreductase n=1 Tax=Pacificispira spongiicola TaxID=2729598 RepID=A0A7Y0DXV8_9PROT|nr:di-heme oxidoredictase family protein [Pacificispira spongiicola]NMM43473.1 thiol oxidoreductase [Pacificispira spongiicola]
MQRRSSVTGVVLAAIVAATVPAITGSASAAGGGGPGPFGVAAFMPGEDRPGGDATHMKPRDRNTYSHPSANMPFEDQLDFNIGNGFFKRLWVSSPSSTKAADGLGPLFNARGCQRCHVADGGGHAPAANYPDDTAVTMLMRLSVPARTAMEREALASGRASAIPDPVYGGQLQDFGVQSVPAEGHIHIDYTEEEVRLADGTVVSLRKPAVSLTDPGYGPPDADLMISLRIATPMIGLGLLELIPEDAILAHADPADKDGDGISGRANRVWDIARDRLALGRFGWKAGQPTLDQQNQSAFSGDIGISTPLFPAAYGDCSAAQALCRDAPHGDDAKYDGLEAPQEVTDLLLFYARNLAVPSRPDAADETVLMGKAVFLGLGCDACHVQAFTTGPSEDSPHLANQVIYPYTDLLLHDMGDGLADNRPEALADGREWRTAPLWGIGVARIVSEEATYLHDGRARTLLEAILWHGGEAQSARDGVVTLSTEEREALIRFLKSL